MNDAPVQHPIVIPKEMVNDDAYLVAAVFAKNGERVHQGQLLAELETSKSTFTLASPADGYFHPHYAVGQMVPVGELFGIVGETASPGVDAATPDTPQKPDPRFSLAAWDLFQASGLPAEAFAGMSHVKRRDVEAAAARAAAAFTLPAGMAEGDLGAAVVMLGGGGHARECIDIVERAGALRIVGVLDSKAASGADVAGHPVLGNNADLPRLLKAGVRNLVLAYGIAGEHAARGRHFRELLDQGFLFPNIVHPQAALNRHARLGRGVQIMAGAMVGSQAELGDACIVNSNAVVSHDCALETNVHVAPGAVLAGGVRVGRDTVIGMGATVYMRVRVGAGVIIHNGANVFSDVPDGAVVRSSRDG